MNRDVTNTIRHLMDNYLPSFLRDNKYFMYPMFYIWFKGKNVSLNMEFKLRLDELTEEDYIKCYEEVRILSNRKTDLNESSIDFIMNNVGDDLTYSIIDIGCGAGYILSMLKEKGYNNLMGCDIVNRMDDQTIDFTKANIEKLPFPDKAFDVVICNHTLEHLIHYEKAVAELKRITRKCFIITTPRQEYKKYTFDLHVNFYPEKEDLLVVLDHEPNLCVDNKGDWSYLGYIE